MKKKKTALDLIVIKYLKQKDKIKRILKKIKSILEAAERSAKILRKSEKKQKRRITRIGDGHPEFWQIPKEIENSEPKLELKALKQLAEDNKENQKRRIIRNGFGYPQPWPILEGEIVGYPQPWQIPKNKMIHTGVSYLQSWQIPKNKNESDTKPILEVLKESIENAKKQKNKTTHTKK